MKKIVSILLIGIMTLSLAACGGGSASSGEASNDGGSAKVSSAKKTYEDDDFKKYYYVWLDFDEDTVHITANEIEGKTTKIYTSDDVDGSLVRNLRDNDIFQYTKVIIDDEVVIDSAAYMFYDWGTLNKIINVSNIVTKNASNMFNNDKKLKEIDADKMNVSYITDMEYMFASCESLVNLNLSNWDTSNVKNMSFMFAYCENLENLNVSNWNTSSVEDMSYMFDDCASLKSLDLSKWDVSHGPFLNGMFMECRNLKKLNVSSWNIPERRIPDDMFGNGCNESAIPSWYKEVYGE